MIAKILGALLLLALAGFGIQSWRVSHYESKVAAFQSAVITFQSAQRINLQTIAKLQSANEAWAGKYAADVAKASKEAQDATAYAEQQHKAAQSAQKALHDLSQAHPEVRAWADVVVPPSVVRVLTGSQD